MRRVERRHSSPGFTLLELIVTFTILSLIVVMVLGALRLGTASWERGERKADLYQKKRIVFQLLSQQIKSSYAYKVKAQKAEGDYLAFLGKGDSLRFVSTFSIRAKRPEGLVAVMYQVEEGRISGKILKVYEQRVLNKDFMEETPEEEKFLPLLEDLSDFKFEFFEAGEDEEESGKWVETWDGKEKIELPRQVRMTVSWSEGKKETEISLPMLVSLPAFRYDDRAKATRRVPLGTPSPRPR